MIQQPVATIVMPLRSQRDEWLREALDSAIGQTVPAEVIVVTSPFTPASNRAVLAAAADASGLVVVERPAGAGFADAINLGFRSARCERVGLLLTDDWLSPDAVERCLAHDADIVSTGRIGYAADGRRVLWRGPNDEARYDRLEGLEPKASYLKHFLLFRRTTMLEAGGVDPGIGVTGADDYDLVWTMLERGATVRLVREELYHYRDHLEERLTLRDHDAQIADLRRIFAKHGLPPEDAERVLVRKAQWLGVPTHVAIADPQWHLQRPAAAGSRAGGERSPLDAGIAEFVTELGWRPERTTLLRPGGDGRHAVWRVDMRGGLSAVARRLLPAESASLATLPPLAAGLPLARLLGRHDDVILEEWVDAPTCEPTRDDPATTRRVGDMLGRVALAGHPSARPPRLPAAALLGGLDAALAALIRVGSLDGAVAERVAARARSNLPGNLPAGILHLDCRPEHVRVTAAGPVLVGLHHLAYGILDQQLARAWCQWPMSSASRARFLGAYARHRPTRQFLLYELFWAAFTLATVAAERLHAGQPADDLAVALRHVASGELPREWAAPPAAPEAPVRVAYICDYLMIGGQERAALELIRGLDRRHFEPFLYAFRGGTMEPAFRALGIPMEVASSRDPMAAAACWTQQDRDEKGAWRDGLAAALRRDRIEAALVFGWRDAAAAGRSAGVPVMIERLDGPTLVGKVADKRDFQRVVAQSATLRDAVIARAEEFGIDAARVELVFTGVDLDRFDARGADRQGVRKALGLGADDLVVGTVGRLVPGKNIDLLVEAFATIPADGLPGPCRLLVVGPDHGSLGMLRDRAAALGVADRVAFLPGTSDVRPAYAAMDVFAMTSLGEGLPNVILEAMAMGLPIVTTGAGSIPEAMDGNGFLLPGAGPARIGRRIARLLRDARLRRRMGDRSLAIAARFAMRHSVGRYEEMMLECLAAGARRGD